METVSIPTRQTTNGHPSKGRRWDEISNALVGKPNEALATFGIAVLNVALARGLNGSAQLDPDACIDKLDGWAEQVREKTERWWPRFLRSPSEFDHSPGHFYMMALATVLQRDLGVRYNLAFSQGDYDASDSRDLFLHGLLGGRGGNCVTVPVLYVAVGRRLGYPLQLVQAKEHLFARWDEPGVGRFITEDPTEFEAEDANLYRYVGNSPTNATDPTGLKKVPLPVAPAGTILPAIANLPMAWYRRPYGLAPILPKKPNIIKNVGEIRPMNCGIALTGVMGGNHQVAGLPLAPNSYFGVSGAGLCIGVVVVTPTELVAFHFSATDDSGATLSQYSWPANSVAVLCGGNNTPLSNDQMVEALNSLRQLGIKVNGIINMDGCFYGPGGKWYVGSTTKPSQDSSQPGQ